MPRKSGKFSLKDLFQANYDVVVVDNFANCVESKDRMAESLIRAQEIAGREIYFYPCDLLDKNELSEVFKKVGTHSDVRIDGPRNGGACSTLRRSENESYPDREYAMLFRIFSIKSTL